MRTLKTSLLLIIAFAVHGWTAHCRAAGDVTAVISAFPPTLEITGDPDHNALAILGDEDGTIWVIGLEDTSPGGSGKGTLTTVNGGLVPFIVPPGAVLSLTVGLGAGDDMVSVADVMTALGTEIRTGDGDDAIDVERGGSVFIHAGTGRDAVVARDVSGSLIVGNDGRANDSMSVLIERLTGSLDLLTGAGQDEIVLRDVDTTDDIATRCWTRTICWAI